QDRVQALDRHAGPRLLDPLAAELGIVDARFVINVELTQCVAHGAALASHGWTQPAVQRGLVGNLDESPLPGRADDRLGQLGTAEAVETGRARLAIEADGVVEGGHGPREGIPARVLAHLLAALDQDAELAVAVRPRAVEPEDPALGAVDVDVGLVV